MTQGGLPPAVVIEGAQRLVEAASRRPGIQAGQPIPSPWQADMVAVAVDTARKQWQTDAAGGRVLVDVLVGRAHLGIGE